MLFSSIEVLKKKKSSFLVTTLMVCCCHQRSFVHLQCERTSIEHFTRYNVFQWKREKKKNCYTAQIVPSCEYFYRLIDSRRSFFSFSFLFTFLYFFTENNINFALFSRSKHRAFHVKFNAQKKTKNVVRNVYE